MRKILVVDDNIVNRQIMHRILTGDYDVLEANNGEQALAVVKEQNGKLAAILLDIIMPVMDGYEFLKIITESRYKNIPIIVTTGNSDNINESRALEMGAWDFVTKPYDPRILKARVKNIIDRREGRSRYLAEFDTLTGIYNKSYFFSATRQMINGNRDKRFAFIRCDIERFKLVNTFYGTEEGNNLLVYIAYKIKEMSLGWQHFAYGRIEADIFGMCVTYDGADEVVSNVTKMRELLMLYDLEFDIVPVFGIYLITEPDIDVNIMYDRATLASKSCKGNYLKSYAFYNDAMETQIVKEQLIVNTMRTALLRGEFIVYLQPKYDLRTNKVAGAEALVRWATPQRGMISPNDFIPVFERNGFISRLDYYMLEQVCQLLAKWSKAAREPYPVSVNISRVNLYNPKLVDMIVALVEKYRIAPKLLQIELTESAYTDNSKAIIEAMERLRRHGFVILMDDFGSGYSSLNVLKDIVVDGLKIDMRFFSQTGATAGRGENIIAAVVRMAKWLNLPIIAEGVEKGEQVEFLRSIGCEYVQGYFFARPMPVDRYELLVARDEAFNPEIEQDQIFDPSKLWVDDSSIGAVFSNALEAGVVYEYSAGKIERLRVNKAFYDLFGYDEMAFGHGELMEKVDVLHRDLLQDTFRRVVESKDSAECDYIRKAVNGRRQWIHLKLKYVHKIGDKHILLGSLLDITTQKELDIELHKYKMAMLKHESGIPKMLIVDDIMLNRTILKGIFKDKYEVIEAADGRQALERLEEYNNEIDIILLDLVMPVMDGTEFLEHKKRNPNIVGIPVVIITSDDNPATQIGALTMGAVDYIVKPFVMEIVQLRVNNAFESNRHFRNLVKLHCKIATGSEQVSPLQPLKTTSTR